MSGRLKKKETKRVLPHKQKDRQQQQDEEEKEVGEVPAPPQRRQVRKTTTEVTVRSAEKHQQYVRGIAENSKKRKALAEERRVRLCCDPNE